MGDTATILIAVLGSGGLFSVLGAIVIGLFSKRKLGAESTEIIQRAASGVVRDMQETLERNKHDMIELRNQHHVELIAMRQENTSAIDKIEREHHEEREDWRRVLQLHAAWDYIAIDKLGHFGVELPPPPPILPPKDRR